MANIFIKRASSGMGAALAKQPISHGQQVYGTFNNIQMWHVNIESLITLP